MKSGYRLLGTMFFVVFVLPYLVFNVFGGKTVVDQKKQLQEYEQQELQFRDDRTAHASKLYNSVEELRVRDPKFKQCIIDGLHKYKDIPPSSSGYISSVTELTSLSCYRMGITDITGISKLVNLARIDLSSNDIQTLSPLTYHPALKELEIQGNRRVRDLEVLKLVETLRSVRFPDLAESYCYEALHVHEVLVRRGGGSSNANSIDCLGKRNHDVSRILERDADGKKLTSDEARKLREYRLDQRRR